ncbi:MAG TPA: transglutaminase-like domain-containing protein [Thermoplasmata archaeon]|nr:transglutaminase-like domain-containing protein [Thermoplasmata archaeon]
MVAHLADFEDPLVREVADRLTAGESTPRGKIERLFAYVHDDIKFQFPAAGDLVKASDTIRTSRGQCNTKGTLLLALCKAVGIPARSHFSLISKNIQRGIFTGPTYWLMPAKISHSWVEVEVDGRWRRIDAYINDSSFQHGALAEIARRNWQTGFSVAMPTEGEPATGLDLDTESFVQMAAVTDDQGAYDDPAEFYASPLYRNRPGRWRLVLYRLMLGRINRRVEQIRQGR